MVSYGRVDVDVRELLSQVVYYKLGDLQLGGECLIPYVMRRIVT